MAPDRRAELLSRSRHLLAAAPFEAHGDRFGAAPHARGYVRLPVGLVADAVGVFGQYRKKGVVERYRVGDCAPPGRPRRVTPYDDRDAAGVATARRVRSQFQPEISGPLLLAPPAPGPDPPHPPPCPPPPPA